MHAFSILIAIGLLAALGAVLEVTLRAHWPQITAALRGDLPR